ncbi:glutathione peroxidase [Gemmatimonas sp.]|uniref:glutathione peroxidase n=1 Tax=Gemmatimonas sp. TaxID=1962908 RepID=UPI00286C5095|nr:glutathione peroxidase [Gemmatimonas sp.]
MSTLSDFTVTSVLGEPMPLSSLAGGVTLVVNVASQCGLTPQYAGLEELYRSYHAQGLTVLGCPCNQFGGQEPGTEETIVQFCSTHFDVTFPLTAKLDVNGGDADALWQWMRSEKPGLLGSTSIKWNFTKFLIARDGRVLERFDPTTLPSDMIPAIERALAASAPAA